MKDQTDLNLSDNSSPYKTLPKDDDFNQSIKFKNLIEPYKDLISEKSDTDSNNYKRVSIEFDSNLNSIIPSSNKSQNSHKISHILENNFSTKNVLNYNYTKNFSFLDNNKDSISNNNSTTLYNTSNITNNFPIIRDFSAQNHFRKKSENIFHQKEYSKKTFLVPPPDPLPKRTVFEKIHPRFGKMRDYIILPEFIGEEPIKKMEFFPVLKSLLITPPAEKQYEVNIYLNSTKVLSNLIYLKIPLSKDGYIITENLININKLNKLYEEEDEEEEEQQAELKVSSDNNSPKNSEINNDCNILNQSLSQKQINRENNFFENNAKTITKKVLKKKSNKSLNNHTNCNTNNKNNNNCNSNTLHNNKSRQLSPYYKLKNKNDKTLIFESRFESGNLLAAFKTEEENSYQLYLQNDTNTTGYIQWFFFSVSNTTKGKKINFNIINLLRKKCIYSRGLQIMVYSTLQAKKQNIGWHRDCTNIMYYPNNLYIYNAKNNKRRNLHTLVFDYEFLYDNDKVYFANCIPYFYSKLMKELSSYELDEDKYPYFEKKNIATTLGGNNVEMITINTMYDIFKNGVTSIILPKVLKKNNIDIETYKKKNNTKLIDNRKAIIIIARQHPGETVGSYVMQGCLDFLMGNSDEAKKLRQIYLFKIIPIMNPDGSLVGNSRTSFAGCDLNRRWQKVNELIHPEVFYTKQMILKLAEQRNIAFIIDFHGHFGTYNALFYGNYKQNKKTCKLFPYICSKLSKIISFQQSTFSMPRYKKSTERISLFNELEDEDNDNIVCVETSFFGTSNHSPYGKIYFNSNLLKEIGRDICLGMLAYYYKFEKKTIFPDIFKNLDVDMREFDSEIIREVNEEEEEVEEEKSESEPSIDNLTEKQLMRLMPSKNKRRRRKLKNNKTKKFDKKKNNDINIELFNPIKEAARRLEEEKRKKATRTANKISIDCKKEIAPINIPLPNTKNQYTQTEEIFFKMHWSYFAGEYKILSYKNKNNENNFISNMFNTNNNGKKTLLNIENDVFGNLFRKGNAPHKIFSNRKNDINKNLMNSTGRNQMLNNNHDNVNNNNSTNAARTSSTFNKKNNLKMYRSVNNYKNVNIKNAINNNFNIQDIEINKDKFIKDKSIVPTRRNVSGKYKSFPLRNMNHN